MNHWLCQYDKNSILQKDNAKEDSKIIINFKTTGLLIIWCFLAGFSESLISNLLIRTEKQIDNNNKLNNNVYGNSTTWGCM